MLKIMQRLFLLAGLISPLFCSAQYNFFKGYVVTNARDTLKGQVFGREGNNNPSSVRYKSSPSAETQVFSIDDCAAFGVDGKEFYERHKVKISLSRISFQNVPNQRDTTFKENNVFLKVLQKGKHVNLFAYTDAIKTRFYVSTHEDPQPVELRYDVFYHPQIANQVMAEARYRNQLVALFRQYGISERHDSKLERAEYATSDMLKIVSLINGQTQEKPKNPITRFFVGGGIMLSNAKYQGRHALASKNAVSKSSPSPYFSAGIDFFVDPAFGKTIIRMELSAFSTENSIAAFTEDSRHFHHQLKRQSLGITLMLLRNLYNGLNHKIFIGAGFAMHLVNIKDNTMTYSYLPPVYTEYIYSEKGPDPEEFQISLPLTIGATIYKRFEISGAYTIPGNVSSYPGYRIKQDRYRFGLSYLINKR